MKIKRYIIPFFGLLLLIFTGCKQEPKHEEEEEQGHEPANVNEVSLTGEQFKAIGVTLSPLQNRTLSNTVKANGVLGLPPQNMASVSAMLGGTIKIIYVIEGEKVKKGQKLALVEHPEYIQLQQDYLEAKSNYAYLEKEYKRQKTLVDEKIVAAKKFQQVEAEYEAQRASLSAMESKLRLMGLSPESISKGNMTSGMVITSPIDGYINKIEVNTGSYAEPQREIFQIVDNHHIHIDLNIYQEDLTRVRVGQKVYFTLTGHEQEDFEAIIFATGKAFDDATKSVTIHAEIKENKHSFLLPGMYVDARIVTDSNEVMALPEDAIISEGDLHYIFIAKGENEAHAEEEHDHGKEEHAHEAKKEEDGHAHKEEKDHEPHEEHGKKWVFEKVLVKPGITDGGYTQITPLTELPANTQIVLTGAYYIAAEMKKQQGGEEEHAH
jgi:membrane fusion protein, heavy metal efflux system